MATVITLLGRPQVVHEGVTAALHAERRCQLLALLALRRSWVPRAELAELFWPGHRRELAAANLRKALHHARALPWAAALETQAGAVRMTVETDMFGLDRAVREGRIADALEHCRGELLDGMDDGASQAWTDWLDSERALHARRVHELTRARLAQLEGRTEPRIALARRMLDADPLDEDAVVALLAAQRELGQWEAQREAYRSYELRLEEELGVAPSQRVRKQLRDGLPAAPAATPGAAGDGFFGRAKELAELAALLTRDACRLLTVTGPGGAGKSTLMKHALRRLQGQFADGALWIALDDLQAAGQVPARIAAELQLAPGPQQEPLPLICAHLANRQMLLVFDNGEHLQGLADLAQRLLDSAARLKICVTSRVRLGAQSEWLLPLAGLDVPGPQASAQEVLASDGVRMFVASALAARPEFDAQHQTEAIGALVRATDGLPLAILLAADWVRHLSVAEIVQELETSLDVLDGGAAEGEERPEHRSMRATFERSWQMLATREQRALAALSVFVGGFTHRAARDVAQAALPLLAALADKSLVQLPAGGRCSLHPLIRQFAAEKLDADAADAAALRHAEWFHLMLARLSSAAEVGDPAALAEIEADLENCRQAWRDAVTRRTTATIASSAQPLMRFFEVRNRAEEGCTLLREALPLCAQPGVAPGDCADLLGAVAHLLFRLYRLDDAALTARQGLRHARSAGRHGARLRCLNVLGLCHWHWGRNGDARRILEQSLRCARAFSDLRAVCVALGNLALIDKAMGDYDRARERLLEVLEQQRVLGDWIGVATRLNALAHLHQSRGEWSQARDFLNEGLAVCEQHGITLVRPHLLVNLAIACFLVGDLDEAERVGLQTLDEARLAGNRNVEATALLHLVRVGVKRGDTAAARARLDGALVLADAMGNVSMQLDAVFCFAEIVAAEGDRHRASALMRYYIGQAEVEPGDRAVAQAALDSLPAGSAGASMIEVPLVALLRELRAALAAGASAHESQP